MTADELRDLVIDALLEVARLGVLTQESLRANERDAKRIGDHETRISRLEGKLEERDANGPKSVGAMLPAQDNSDNGLASMSKVMLGLGAIILVLVGWMIWLTTGMTPPSASGLVPAPSVEAPEGAAD